MVIYHMNNILLHNLTLTELIGMLDRSEISSKELFDYFKKRINTVEQGERATNSFITKDLIDIIDLKTNDEGKRRVPIAHKDIFCTKGVRTTCGSKMLGDFIPPYSATIVDRLENSGYTAIAKCNMDEFAMGSSNETSYFGVVKNPWDLSKVPGGSSGGSAASVAARLIPATTGTDTGGSIRQPAAFCGVTGLKPTYGRISRFGQIAFASSLDQAGFIAKTAEDCALLLSATAGFDPHDHTSHSAKVDDYLSMLHHSIKNKVIAVPEEFFDALGGDYSTVLLSSLKLFEKLGATLKKVHFKHHELALSVYQIISAAECSSNLARYDGVRYGFKDISSTSLEEMYITSRSLGFGAEVKRRILLGAFVLSSKNYSDYYLKASKLINLISSDYDLALNDADLIATPTTPTVAFGIGEKSNNSMQMYQSDLFTAGINLAQLPAISLPVGMYQDLPVGLQLVGKKFDESVILNAAHQFQCNSDYHQLVPDLYR